MANELPPVSINPNTFVFYNKKTATIESFDPTMKNVLEIAKRLFFSSDSLLLNSYHVDEISDSLINRTHEKAGDVKEISRINRVSAQVMAFYDANKIHHR